MRLWRDIMILHKIKWEATLMSTIVQKNRSWITLPVYLEEIVVPNIKIFLYFTRTWN